MACFYFRTIEITPTCYLEGTRLQADGQEIAVEDLRIGDPIDTQVAGEVVRETIRWIGSRSVTTRFLPEIDAHPVRIRAGAFAPDVPRRDLLITPEHCVFVDGRLVPARMLVNGGTIIIDRTISAYTFYHVELERHAILIAEGLGAESYLDTGNRRNFANTDAPALRPDLSLVSDHLSWKHDAAAPLAVAQHFVEPIWQRLAARALESGQPVTAVPVALEYDPNLHIATGFDWGDIRPARRAGSHFTFMVPEGVAGLRLRSRAARPSEVIGPFVDDRRRLGVKVGRIRLLGRHKPIEVTSHLEETALSGWHMPEAIGDSGRWTDGDAALPLMPGKGPTLIEIEILAAGPYLRDAATDDAIATAS